MMNTKMTKHEPTDAEINEAIAREMGLCGHERTTSCDGDECLHCGIAWHLRDQQLCYIRHANYCTSLDAMAEVEKALWVKGTPGDRYRYYEQLWQLTSVSHGLVASEARERFGFATARQRSEAFCRVRKIGPFKETA